VTDPDPHVDSSRPSESRWSGALRTVGLDLVAPLLVFRICRGAGVPEVWSLVISGFPPAVGVLIDWLRWRTLEMVGAVVLAGIGLSIVLALLTDDPTVVLLEGAIITGAFGLLCLGTVRRRRPLIFFFAQAFYGGRHSRAGQELDEDFETYDEAQRFWRIVTVVWGVTYVVEAVVRALVIQAVSTQTALLLNRTVPWLVYGVLLAWSFWWGNRLRAEKPDSPAEGRPDR
jgi:hypothetical protein